MKRTFFKIGFLALVLFALDQIPKWLAAHYLMQAPFQITSFLTLSYQQNYGLAWSIPIPYNLLIALNTALLILVPVLLAKNLDLRRKTSQILLSFVLGGALGNLFDRLTKGYVVDYVAVGSFPVFNLADALLTIGIFLIVVFYGRIRRN